MNKKLFIAEQPRFIQKLYAKSLMDGMSNLGIEELGESESLLEAIEDSLYHVPHPVPAPDAHSIKWMFLLSVGAVFGQLVVRDFGWRVGWLLEEEDKAIDGVSVLVSPAGSLFVQHLDVIVKESGNHGGQSRLMYERCQGVGLSHNCVSELQELTIC